MKISNGVKPVIKVGQIFLTHPRDQNFTSVYEETFSKQGGAVYLFAVIEVAETGENDFSGRKEECQKLARAMVSTLKRTYIALPVINEEIFEKALASVNATLARLASREFAYLLPRLNAAIGVVFGNTLSLAVCGNSIVYLKRQNELTLLSEGLASDQVRPTKLFSNYSSGRLAPWDRVLMSSRELLNFLSLERLQEFLAEETLEEACSEIIDSLGDIKDTGFAAYVFDVSPVHTMATARKPPFLPAIFRFPKNTVPAGKIQNFLKTTWAGVLTVLELLWRSLVWLANFIGNFFAALNRKRSGGRYRSKKYLVTAIVLIILIFLVSLAFGAWRRHRTSSVQTQTEITNLIEQKLSEGEAALIYNNQNLAVTLAPEIETLLQKLASGAETRPDFEKRLQDLKNKVNKEFHVENPTVLATLENTPTNLIHSPNGFLAFNRNSGRLVFYDFRTGSTRQIFQNQNTGNLSFGLYLGSGNGFVFLGKDGKWQKLNPDNDTLTLFESAPTENPAPSDLGRAKSLTVLGEDSNARIYILDAKNRQIWRLNVDDAGIAAPQAWLKTNADFESSLAIGADNSIYVLYPGKLDKYANGTKQNLAISPIEPPAQNLSGLYVSPDTASIYVPDREHSRIIVLSKQGQLERQIISTKFRDLADIYVDEKAGLLYAAASSELLQISLK